MKQTPQVSTSAAEFVIMFLVELLKFYIVQLSMARTDDRRSFLAEETKLWSIARTSKGSKQSTKKKKIARGATNTSYSKEKRTARQQALRLGVCTLKPTHRNGQRQTRCARVGAWQLCKLCLGLTKRYRHDKVRHAAEFLLRWRNFGT